MTHKAENTHDRALDRKRSPSLALTITIPALNLPADGKEARATLPFSRAGDRAELLGVISEARALGTAAQSGSLKSRDKRKRKACLGPPHRCHCDRVALGRRVLPVTQSKLDSIYLHLLQQGRVSSLLQRTRPDSKHDLAEVAGTQVPPVGSGMATCHSPGSGSPQF